MVESDDVIDFESARKRVEVARQDQKEKDLERKFKKAMGWKDKAKVKKKHGSKGPKPTKPRGKGKRR